MADGTEPITKVTSETVPNLVQISSGKKSWDETIKERYESFWLIPESHPSRLGTHIVLRGVFTGATLMTLGGIPYVIYRKKRPFLSSLGKLSLRGGVGGGILLGLLAAERLHHLDSDGIKDRSYRLAYNWSQTKWDFFAVDGAILGAFLLRRVFGGIGPGAAIGTVLGTFAWIGANALKR